MSASSMAPEMHPGEDNMTTFLTRRMALLAAATCAATLGFASIAQAQTSVKIGYALSRTGPNAGGAAVTTLPNYEMWVKEVNAAGGLKLGDKRVPIEVVQYDDRSSAEEAAKRAGPADHPGQGRFHPAALGHRPQSRGRTDPEQGRLSASRVHRGHRPRARTGETLAQQFLVARHQRGRANTLVELLVKLRDRRQDRRHRRDGQRRRRFRHRPFGRGAAGD